MIAKLWADFRRAEAGALSAEFAIVGTVLVSAVIGMIEIGRVVQINNDLSYAADRAARRVMIDRAATTSDIEATARAAFDAPNEELMTATVQDSTVDGEPVRTITLSYPVTMMFPGLQKSFSISATRRAPRS